MTPLPLAAAQDAPGLRIGEMAKISGFSVKTIRFYCDQGLLHTARSEGGYRIFSSESIAELEIIRALRSMDGAYQERSPLRVLLSAPHELYSESSVMGFCFVKSQSTRS